MQCRTRRRIDNTLRTAGALLEMAKVWDERAGDAQRMKGTDDAERVKKDKDSGDRM
jgi:heme-degrading monooxygenase HmoA